MKCPVILVFLSPLLLAQDATTVDGVVVNSITGAGIEGADVRLSDHGGHRYEAVTDQTGAFRITGVVAEDYDTSFDKIGYFRDDPFLFAQARTAHVGSGATHLRFELIPPGTLRGRVIGVDGKPAARVEVSAIPRDSIVTTDDNGDFAVTGLGPGFYTLMARTKTKESSLEEGVRTEIVPTYYPSALDRNQGQAVDLLPGADQGSYEIRLRTAAVHRVRGVALDALGKPAAKAVVQLVARNPGAVDCPFLAVSSGGQKFSIDSEFGVGPRSLEDPIVTGADGKFEFNSVREGDWMVSAESDTIHDEASGRDIALWGNLSLAVGRTDADDLTMRMQMPFTLTGTFELSDGSPLPRNPVGRVALCPAEGFHGQSAFSLEGNAIQIQNVSPGAYRIDPMVFGGSYYPAAVVLGNSNVTGQAVELSAASPPFRIVLKPAGSIRGTVEHGEGTTVLLLPQNLKGIGQTALCRAGGSFDFDGLAPGDYYAVALEHFDWRPTSNLLQDSSRLGSLVTRATQVHVEGGAVASLQLHVN